VPERETKTLKKGWTTGACATAATKAAFEALLTGTFAKTVTITLPKGQTPTFDVIETELKTNCASAGIIKDAGDDPDVTHGATIIATITKNTAKESEGIIFKAGEGVGTVTKAGLPIPPGEPAINPMPRTMMEQVIKEMAEKHQVPADVTIEISVPGGEKISKQTWNGRLGIIGGISILGTTGIVVPYSCSAWIHSIHRGIDVARAANTHHIGAAVGNMSEKLIIKTHDLDETDILDMGDFVGGMLKYLKKHPVPKLTIAGGFAKMSKLAQGEMDLHSKRSQVDKGALAHHLKHLGASKQSVDQAKSANTALEILQIAQQEAVSLGDIVAKDCLKAVQDKLQTDEIKLEILLCDRKGILVGRAADNGF